MQDSASNLSSLAKSQQEPLKKQGTQDFSAARSEISILRPKGSSFHSKKEFKFQGNVNFHLNQEKTQARPRVLTIQTRKTHENSRSPSVKRQETAQSELNPSSSNISLEDEPKFQQINIFGNTPASPKTPRKRITLKKSLSSQRPSILSIFSKIKKKNKLDLSDEEDFKVFS